MLRIGVIMYQTSATKGQELVAQRMVREFNRQGYDAYLITSVYHDWEPVVAPDEVKKKGGYVHLFDRKLGIPTIRVNSGELSWPPRRVTFVDFMGTLTDLVKELDLNVLITHSTLWNGPEEVAKFADWRRRLIEGGTPHHPVIFCHMSHLQEASGERYAINERSFREAWNGMEMPQILSAADVVLTTTPVERQFMKDMGADEAQLFLFPGGVDDDSLRLLGDPGGFRLKYRLPSRAALVSFLGTVEERKNPAAILPVAQAFRDRKNVHFVIAGNLEGDYAAKLKEQAAGTANVSVLGPITEEDKSGLIKASWLNINMSRSEALGIAQLEFMSLGVPVITSGAGGQSWVVRGGYSGVVLKGPEDVEGAVAAIRYFDSHQSTAGKMGKNAASFAARFTIAHLIDRLAKRLETELQMRSKGVPSEMEMSGDERVIEAIVSGGQKVAATSKRLVVRSGGGGRSAVSIPYDEIARIVRHARVPWATLGVGVAATAFLLGDAFLGVGLLNRLQPAVIAALSTLGQAELSPWVMGLIPLVPITLALLVFLGRTRRGYLVKYGTDGGLFLPEEFQKALRLADKLTPKDLFVEEHE